jgi:hypothetical protein
MQTAKIMGQAIPIRAMAGGEDIIGNLAIIIAITTAMDTDAPATCKGP